MWEFGRHAVVKQQRPVILLCGSFCGNEVFLKLTDGAGAGGRVAPFGFRRCLENSPSLLCVLCSSALGRQGHRALLTRPPRLSSAENRFRLLERHLTAPLPG